VKVIMTRAARDFITPLTLSTLSKNPVLEAFFEEDSGRWESHVDLGLWADAFVIAPASANTIAKMANGQCDNLLTAVYLSARCPVFIAPAMDLDMYQHPATISNLHTLEEHGVTVIPAGVGDLASGLVGEGRMSEPESILAFLEDHFDADQPLKGRHVLVTAGPTHEAIDPVRFIGNHSSGKMGYAIAEELSQLGASVELVSGPTAITGVDPAIRITQVTSAEEMYRACLERFPKSDITVLAAAVADYRPASVHESKIKKEDGDLRLNLEKTIDIAEDLGKKKKEGQFIVGFALETDNEIEHAKIKLKSKNFDLIVLNSLRDEGAGFGYDTNKIRILGPNIKMKEFGLKSKKEVARDIVRTVLENINA